MHHDGRRIPSDHLLLPAVSVRSSNILVVVDTIMGVSSHTPEAEAAATVE
jgi:hypothetical protein